MLKKVSFLLVLACCALPFVSPSAALILGGCFALIFGNPWVQGSARASRATLQLSVVGLGFALRLPEVLSTGREYFLYTVVGITSTLLAGYLLGRLLGTGRNISLLVSFGTAICGGSAIAAMAPVIKAEDHETAVSLATIFTLNFAALLTFPLVGHLLGLSQELFGAWSGLAIHDTSSVVGAASAYGPKALAVGTTVKLTRALWITPLVIGASWLFHGGRRAALPLFIVGFLLAAALRTFAAEWNPLWEALSAIARQGLVVTLFLIGSGLTREVLRRVGVRPLLQGFLLWCAVSAATLGALLWVGSA